MAVGETLRAIREQATDLITEQYQVLNDLMLPSLANERIFIVRRDRWSSAQDAWIRRYFNDELLAILSPIGPGSGPSVPAHPQQEPELHRAAAGQGRLRPPQRHGHGAGATLPAAGDPGAGHAMRATTNSCCCRP